MSRAPCRGSLSDELPGTLTTSRSSAGRRRAFRALRRAWIGLRGDRVWRAALHRSPPVVRRRLRRLRASLAIWGEHTLVPVDELHAVYRRGLSLLIERNGRESIGDYLEFGVYVGTSLACMHRVTDELGLRELRLFGFDSFEGLPAHASDDDEARMWEPGSFASDEEFTRRNLMREGVDWSRVVLVPGWFDETLTRATADAHGIRKASVLMFDCDLYASTRKALEFSLPLIVDEAVLVFDDWDSGGLGERGLGERRAFEEVLAEHPDLHSVELPAYEPARAFLVSRLDPDAEIQGLTPGVTKG